MTDNIQAVIKIIKKDKEYFNYFFKNIHNLKTPEKWFLPLYQATILNPDKTNHITIPYTILLLTKHFEDELFINLIIDWIKYFQVNNEPAHLAIWLVENAIRLNSDEVQNVCGKFLIDCMSDENYSDFLVMSLDLGKFDDFLNHRGLMYEMVTKLVEFSNFKFFEKNSYHLIKISKKYADYVIKNKKEEYKELILNKLLDHLKISPNEYVLIDTIDQNSHIFGYANYILKLLVDLIENNNNAENEAIFYQLNHYVKAMDHHDIEKTTILKVLLFIVKNINKYELINCIQENITFLEHAKDIKYALYQLLDAGVKADFKFLPQFENWLENLIFSVDFKQKIQNNGFDLDLYEKDLRLGLLYPFKNTSRYFKHLSEDFIYQIQPPQKSFEIKSSDTSENNYIGLIAESNIDVIIAYLNNYKSIPVETDFPEIHMERAIKADFAKNKQKYVKELQTLFKDLNSNYHKSLLINLLKDDYNRSNNKDYQLIFPDIFEVKKIDMHYLYDVLRLLNALLKTEHKFLLEYIPQLDKLLKDYELKEDQQKLDELGGGLNSIPGLSINIFVELSRFQDNTLMKFAEQIDNYKFLLENDNAIYYLGRYLPWLYKNKVFKKYFECLNIKKQNIALLGYIVYCQYADQELFKLIKKNKLIAECKGSNLYKYMNCICYHYLMEKDNYISEIISSHLDSKEIMDAVVVSLETYSNQISQKKLEDRAISIWKLLLSSKEISSLAEKLSRISNHIDLNNSEHIKIFVATVEHIKLNTIAHNNIFLEKLNELLNKQKYGLLLKIFIKLTRNSTQLYFISDSLDNIFTKLKKETDNFKLDETKEYNELLGLLARLGYHYDKFTI